MFPRFSGVWLLDDHSSSKLSRTVCRGVIRRKVLDLVAAGRPVAQVAHDLQIGVQTSRQQEWAAAHLDLPALAEEVHRLSGEIESLRGLRRQQDTGTQDGAA